EPREDTSDDSFTAEEVPCDETAQFPEQVARPVRPGADDLPGLLGGEESQVTAQVPEQAFVSSGQHGGCSFRGRPRGRRGGVAGLACTPASVAAGIGGCGGSRTGAVA